MHRTESFVSANPIATHGRAPNVSARLQAMVPDGTSHHNRKNRKSSFVEAPLLHRTIPGVFAPADRRSSLVAGTSLASLEESGQQQASSLAYFDCFWVFAMVVLALVPVVLLMKRSVAEKGARIGVE